jgi:glycosyltransferase Alg8
MTNDLSWAGKKWSFPSEVIFSNEHITLRRGATLRYQLAVLAGLVLVTVLSACYVGNFLAWFTHRIELILLFAGIGCWRWGWFVLQSARAILYRYWMFPRLRREAEQAVETRGPVPEVTILAVTYKEHSWITQAVFESVFRELASVRKRTRKARVVVATGCDADDVAINRIYAECNAAELQTDPTFQPAELVLLRGDNGKRGAIASALRDITSRNPHPDGVVIFMDGDSIMQPGLLKKVLPMFRLTPNVDAVTTNEDGWVKGQRWFAEWISLRFGLRHRTMCSIALSGKLLCLTGRLSVFRAAVATDPTFLDQIERDSIHHWLWEQFDMLSGDDKSTWYWLAARGRRMLYVPDAMSTTLEVISGSAVERAVANVRRWSGNSLRHSWRAFILGPRKLGWFCWYSLLDQRAAIWTVLVGPLFAILALLTGKFEIAVGFVLWMLVSRLAHASISWKHGRRFSAYYLPLQILSDWTIALTKVWVLFHPAKQRWMNRGARSLDSTQASAGYRTRTALAHYLYGFSCTTAVIVIGIYSGLIPLWRDSGLYFGSPTQTITAQSPAPAATGPTIVFGMEPATGHQASTPQKSASPDSHNSISHHRDSQRDHVPSVVTTKVFLENL